MNYDTSIDLVPTSDDYDPTGFIVHKMSKPWFLKNGTRFPDPSTISNTTGRRVAKLLPFEDPGNDRFVNQMMFVPPNYTSSRDEKNFKSILLYNGMAIWWSLKAKNRFEALRCPVNTCRLTTDKSKRQEVDLVMFWDYYEATNQTRPLNQLYALYHIEPPFITVPVKDPGTIFTLINIHF